MDCLFNGRMIKYEDGKLWIMRDYKSKPADWYELKGSVNKSNGYRCVKINNKKYLYHRLIYLIHNQKWKIHDTCRDNSIDHIDRNPLNNNIENLRVVSNQENQWNTDAKGYTFNKARGKYQAHIRVDGKLKYLGLFVSEHDARNAYLNAKAIHHQILP